VLTECFKPPGVDRNEISYAEIGETPGVPGGEQSCRAACAPERRHARSVGNQITEGFARWGV